MLNINIESINEKVIVKANPVTKVKLPIFESYINATVKKLEQSISDANGRYVEGHAYANPKPSQNWKVVKTDDDLMKEKLLVWLKVGIKKVEIGGKKEIEVLASNLISVLETLKAAVESYLDNRESDDAKAFHQVAIAMAKPKAKSKKGNEFAYNPETDKYEEVA
jgi:hypothetical protein